MENKEIKDLWQTEMSDEEVLQTRTPEEKEKGLKCWKLSLKEDPHVIVRLFKKVLELFKSGKSVSDIVSTLSDDAETKAIYTEVMQGVDDFHDTVDAFRKADNEGKSYSTLIQKMVEEHLPEGTSNEDKKKILKAVNEHLDKELIKTSEETEHTMETSDELDEKTEQDENDKR